MKKILSTIYDKNYYLNICLGSDEFKKSAGQALSKSVKKILSRLIISEEDTVLDLGCGRGDITLYLAKKAKKVIGIDYSKDAILLARSVQKKSSPTLQRKVNFMKMDVENLKFKENSIDIVVAIDIFEHLTKEQLEKVMKQIKFMLKPDGVLFIHTGTNRILYDYTYRFYIHPMNILLTTIDKVVFRKSYEPLPKDPRTHEEKIQHVNEPTYFYLKDLFSRYQFQGLIQTNIGYIKKTNSIKGFVYNFAITFHPLSKLFPLSTLFGWAFVCNMRNVK